MVMAPCVLRVSLRVHGLAHELRQRRGPMTAHERLKSDVIEHNTDLMVGLSEKSVCFEL